MKILFFLDHIGGGGRERRMAQLVLYLDKIPDVQMMTITATKKIDYTEVLSTKMKIRVVNDSSHWSRVKKYDDIIGEFKPDVIHLWNETPLFCVVLPFLANKYGSKFVVGFVADGRPITSYPFLQRQCIRFTFHKADAVVSNSKAGLIAKKAPEKKSHVIYNGFDKKRLTHIDIAAKRKELGITKKYLITMCARVDAVKDWDMFIGLAEMGKGNDIYFLAVGDGSKLEHYQKKVKTNNLNNIKFIGRRSDVMEIYAATDVSVLFTNNTLHEEGVSNSIMESMAAGIPVVATDGGGTTEIIKDGENGFIIESGNTKQACQVVNNLLNDDCLRQKISVKAHETIEKHFNLDTKGLEYLNLYKLLLA